LSAVSSTGNNNWGLNCCGYDWNTKQCGGQQFFPDFQFLNPCAVCEEKDKLICEDDHFSGDDSGINTLALVLMISAAVVVISVLL